MVDTVTQTVRLARHPESHGKAVQGIEVRVSRGPAGGLDLWYWIEGSAARIAVPPPRPPRFADGLWRHTCCECFVRIAGRPAYHEFNFSPSGEWAAYAFAKYREPAPPAGGAPEPRIAARVGDEGLELDASVPLARLSTAHARAALSIALSAVIEERSGALSWWALSHAPGAPDFHHPDAFVLELQGATE